MFFLKIFTFQQFHFLIFSEQYTNPSLRTGPQDLLVTHYDCEENEQKTLTQIRYKSSNTMRIRTTSYRKHKCTSNTKLKSPINNIKRIQVHSIIS